MIPLIKRRYIPTFLSLLDHSCIAWQLHAADDFEALLYVYIILTRRANSTRKTSLPFLRQAHFFWSQLLAT